MKSLTVEEVTKYLSLKVRTLREEQKLTQEELAVRSDLDVRTIQRIESQYVSVGLKTIIQVSNGLNISLPKLFDIKE